MCEKCIIWFSGKPCNLLYLKLQQDALVLIFDVVCSRQSTCTLNVKHFQCLKAATEPTPLKLGK